MKKPYLDGVTEAIEKLAKAHAAIFREAQCDLVLEFLRSRQDSCDIQFIQFMLGLRHRDVSAALHTLIKRGDVIEAGQNTHNHMMTYKAAQA